MFRKTGFYVSRTPMLAEEPEEDISKFARTDRTMPAFPQIETVFDYSKDHPNSILYNHAVCNILRKLMPHELSLVDNSPGEQREALRALQVSMPQLRWVVWDPSTLNLSIYLLCRFRLNAGKFFYDMISRWLLPGRKANISLFFGADFRLPQLDDQIYSLGEIVVHFDELADYEQALRNLPILEIEIRLGVSSVYHASRILEIKGLAVDEKTCMIQERIVSLLHERPKEFDSDIFSEMQHFLVTGRNEFKAVREVRQMSRLICYFYLMRRDLRQRVEILPEKRHLRLKAGFTRLHLPLGTRRVLGIFVGLNFLNENEVFDENHLVRALQHCLPAVVPVEDSFFVEPKRDDRIHTLYLEIVKYDGSDFTPDEIRRLRRELPEDLKKRVQQLTRPVFMPRNEEEVMRNIVTLSQELRYLRDIPQVIISFDEHTEAELSFTVILVRVLLPHSSPLQEICSRAGMSYKLLIDRIKKMGTVWKKYPKEAGVFRVKLSVSPFVRRDQSLDLFKARQAVLAEVQRLFGEVRDYNGGMIAKQIEVFQAVQSGLGKLAQKHELLLENFFHSILPVEMRSILAPSPIKNLFLMLLGLLEEGVSLKQRLVVKEQEDDRYQLVMIGLGDHQLKGKLFEAVERLHIPSFQLPSVVVQAFDILFVGYLYSCDDSARRAAFVHAIRSVFN